MNKEPLQVVDANAVYSGQIAHHFLPALFCAPLFAFIAFVITALISSELFTTPLPGWTAKLSLLIGGVAGFAIGWKLATWIWHFVVLSFLVVLPLYWVFS